MQSLQFQMTREGPISKLLIALMFFLLANAYGGDGNLFYIFCLLMNCSF